MSIESESFLIVQAVKKISTNQMEVQNIEDSRAKLENLRIIETDLFYYLQNLRLRPNLSAF